MLQRFSDFATHSANLYINFILTLVRNLFKSQINFQSLWKYIVGKIVIRQLRTNSSSKNRLSKFDWLFFINNKIFTVSLNMIIHRELILVLYGLFNKIAKFRFYNLHRLMKPSQSNFENRFSYANLVLIQWMNNFI